MGGTGLERPCKCPVFGVGSVHPSVHDASTSEQLRAVDLSVVEERVRVGVGRHAQITLPDLRADLGPGLAPMVEQADAPMPKMMRGSKPTTAPETSPGPSSV